MADKIVVPDNSGIGWTETGFDRDGNYYHQQKEDVTAILEQNKHERNDVGDQYFGGKGTESSAIKIGSISPLMMVQLIEQGIFWDDKALLKWFGDLDNYLWRTTSKVKG